jgi:hypothetical protein
LTKQQQTSSELVIREVRGVLAIDELHMAMREIRYQVTCAPASRRTSFRRLSKYFGNCWTGLKCSSTVSSEASGENALVNPVKYTFERTRAQSSVVPVG